MKVGRNIMKFHLDGSLIDERVHYLDYRVKKLTDTSYKHIYLKRVLTNGKFKSDSYLKIKKENEEKLMNNIARARTKIFEYAMCNEFDFFVTMTLDPKKYDRFDLPQFQKDLSQFVRNYRRKYGTEIQYLFIPEKHENGAWHIHGLVKGDIVDLCVNEHGYLDWHAYSQKFGYISLDAIRDKERCAKYITKYVSKDIDKNVTALGAHLYYASRGLKVAETLYARDIYDLSAVKAHTMDYQNEFFMVKTRDSFDTLDMIATKAENLGLKVVRK